MDRIKNRLRTLMLVELLGGASGRAVLVYTGGAVLVGAEGEVLVGAADG
jgi:hypothetical protein